MTDFAVKLENAAIIFLNLLRLSKYSKTDLSSISAVSAVFKFLHRDSRLRHITDTNEATTHTQTKLQSKDKPLHTEPARRRRKPLQSSSLSSGEQKAVSAIVMAVKNRRREKAAKHRGGQDEVTQKKATNRIGLKITKQVIKTYESVDDSLDGADNKDEKQVSNYSIETNEKYLDATTTVVPNTLSELQCPHCYKAFIDKRNLRSHLWVHEREKSFQCDVCQKQFLRTHQLTRHKRVHTGERPYPCTVCGKAFADVSNLNTHTRKEHPKHESLVLKCEECGMECQSKKGLKIHLREHEDQDVREQPAEETLDTKPCLVTGNMPRQVRRLCTAKNLCREKEVFLCQICGKGLNKRAALLAHMKRHIHKRNFRCEFCNKVFPELSELKTHRKGHTGDRPYKCQKCGKGFKSQGTLRSHLGVHTGEQPYKCDVCGRSFSQTSGLNQHKLKHTAEEEKEQRCSSNSNNNTNESDSSNNCDICGRCYKTKFRLQLHLKSHDSKRDVSCDFCEKKFQTAHDLAIHRRSHTKDKYSCRVCGVSFKSRSIYYFHTRTHQIDRPYLCSSCGKSFISANNLTAHKRRHVIGNAFKRQHDQFICNVCGKVYQMKNSLLIHMKIHQGIFDHPCDFCEKKFKSHAELRHHRRVHTLEKPYVCETCDRCFSRHSTLVNHRRTHSGERPYMCPTCGAAFKLSCTLKKHAKIHTRENQGHKVRFNSGRGRNSNLDPPPSTPDLYPTQPHHTEQTPQHQQQQLLLQQRPYATAAAPQTNPSMTASLPATITTTVCMAAPHLMQKANNHFIHELKPAPANIIQMDTTAFISNAPNILIDPRNPAQIQQPMREASSGDAGEKEAVRDLTEMQNIVPNSVQYVPGSSTFTTYYYY